MAGANGKGAALGPAPDTPRDWALPSTAAYTEEELQILRVAKNEHAATTEAARRCLQVASETTMVGQATLGALYHQGEQLDRAQHGVEQIDENVQHAGRIIKFMNRCCCFRGDKFDKDLQLERHRKDDIQRQRMEFEVAAEGIAAGYASKRQVVDAAVSQASAGAAHADAAAASRGAAAAAAAAAGDDAAWGRLIAAVPGPLGEERQREWGGTLGEGLEAADRQQLAAETAAQDEYLAEVDGAVNTLRAMGLAMGVELEEQNLKIEAMQQRTEEAGEGLKTVAKSAGKLVGREPRAARCSAGAEQDAAAAAVANAAVKAAPMAVRYGVR